ncbi:hypothetical protein WJX84_006786 [Apatococcus fuscideae]|uniref:Uncharacterized protein n=1 Tax=Apatococcus fuscideae TaxID=2026836 RepID=A0AAW1RL81_9CHLO
MALSQVECGSYLEALANVRAAIPKLRQLAGVGVSYHDCEEIKDALGDMLALQATCQHALGDSAAAEQSARAALEQHPRDDRCITLLAQIKLGQGNRSSAVCLLQEAQQGYRVRPLQDLLENLNTHQDFLHQVLGSWRKSFYWYYSAGAPRESGPRVSLTPRRRLRSRRHDPKLLDYMPNGREFVYKPRDHVEPAWHALCGVAMLVGSLRETHSAGSFSTDGVGIHGDRRMNRTQQNRLAAQKLLPNPEHSLQGRYHETRLLQRVEEEYLQAVSKRIWSIPHKFHSLRRISQHSNLCGRAYLSDSDDAGSDLVHVV